MDLSLETDGPVAALRVLGTVSLGEAGAVSDYLRVARENGAVRCIVDFSGCSWLPTTIVPVLQREAASLRQVGGGLSLTGVGNQNPFLSQAVSAGRFVHYRSAAEAMAAERREVEATRRVDVPDPVS